MARIPIIFGCAEDHELPVAAVADAVQREGYPVEVTTGIDHDPSALASATDRIRGPALFVLCRSEALGRSAALRVEGLLSARKGPRHHVITVDVSKRVPTSAVPAILEAAARLGEDRSRARDEDSGQFMREVVVPTSVAAAPGAVISDRPSRARWAEPMRELVEEPRGISEEALGLHDDDTDVYDADAYDLPPPEPDVLISTDPDSVELARGTAGIPELVDEDDGIPPRASDPELVVPGAPQGLPWEGSGPVEVERVTPRVRADPRAEADDRPLPSASTPIEIGEEPAEYEPPPEPRRSGARVLLLLMAAAGMAGIVMMAVLHDSGFGGGAPEPVVHQRGLPGTATPTVEPGADAGAGSSDGAAAGSGDATGGAAIAGSTGAVEASASTGEGETAGPLEESGGVAASSDEGGSTGAEGGGTDEGDPGPSAGLGDDAAGDDAAGDDAAGND
ncbi:MAG: hypothetical protein KC501_38235, partial [Myxococcales bacterium]|nr:hypothetical protein [Myxococcales bacterium]